MKVPSSTGSALAGVTPAKSRAPTNVGIAIALIFDIRLSVMAVLGRSKSCSEYHTFFGFIASEIGVETTGKTSDSEQIYPPFRLEDCLFRLGVSS